MTDEKKEPDLADLDEQAITLCKWYGVRGHAAVLIRVDANGRYTAFVAQGVSPVLDAAFEGLYEVMDNATAAFTAQQKLLRGLN